MDFSRSFLAVLVLAPLLALQAAAEDSDSRYRRRPHYQFYPANRPSAQPAWPAAQPLPAYQPPSNPPPAQSMPGQRSPLEQAGPWVNPFGPAIAPGKPGVMVGFADTFTGAVTDYIKEKSRKNGGVFVVKDDLTGQPHFLKLLRVREDQIATVSGSSARGCAEFEGVNGMEKVDLDFFLAKDGWNWGVSKVLVHKVDGKPRFVYNSDGEVVRVGPQAVPDVQAQAAPEAQAPRAVPKPAAPAGLSAQALFHEPSGNDRLEAGETGGLTVTVVNSGKGTAYDVHLRPRLYPPVPGLEVPDDVAVGDVKPGQTATAEVWLKAGLDIVSRKAHLTVEVKEGNGFDAEPMLVEFETKNLEASRLSLAGVSLTSGGTVRAGEPTRVAVAVKNEGPGDAQNVVAALVLGSPDIFMSDEPSVGLGDLKPGETKNAEFEFFVNKRIKGGASLPVAVTLTEATGRFGAEKAPLNLVLGQGAHGPKVVSVKAKAEVEDVDLPPETKAPADPEAYAVVVGVERYRDLPAVDYASRDAQTVYDYLTKAMGYGVRNVVLLQNDRATLTDMATYLGPWLKDRAGPKSRVFVYYAGHGSPDPKTGEGYLIPYDGSPAYTETKAYPIKQLYDGLAQLPAKDVTVVIDSCFSGAGGRSVTVAGARPLTLMAKPPPVGENTVAFTAAGSDQISVGYTEGRHGLLTYFLLKGLRGGAADREGRVDTAGLFRFLQPAVEKEARKQHVAQRPAVSPELERLGERGTRVWLKVK